MHFDAREWVYDVLWDGVQVDLLATAISFELKSLEERILEFTKHSNPQPNYAMNLISFQTHITPSGTLKANKYFFPAE